MTSMHYKVKNESLIRDGSTNAILETDQFKLHQYRILRRQKKEKDIIVEDLLDRINRLEQLIEKMANG